MLSASLKTPRILRLDPAFEVPDHRPQTMAEKRYQVFISSTFIDLKVERAKLFQELMNANCIPAGMELFPATNDEQFEFIKTVIDDSDYVLLVVAARYGTPAKDGVSYTEKEFDYAIKQGKTVIALLHEDPSEITNKTDVDPEAAKKLEAFRKKVKDGRIVRYWKTEADVVGATLSGVNHAIKSHPGVGWVRGDHELTVERVEAAHDLERQNIELRQKVEELNSAPILDDLADLDESISFRSGNWGGSFTWGEILSHIAFLLESANAQDYIYGSLGSSLARDREVTLRGLDCQKIKIQFVALGLLKIHPTHGGPVWQLTPRGERTLIALEATYTKRGVKPPAAGS